MRANKENLRRRLQIAALDRYRRQRRRSYRLLADRPALLEHGSTGAARTMR